MIKRDFSSRLNQVLSNRIRAKNVVAKATPFQRTNEKASVQ
jgi:hypothetical protein